MNQTKQLGSVFTSFHSMGVVCRLLKYCKRPLPGNRCAVSFDPVPFVLELSLKSANCQLTQSDVESMRPIYMIDKNPQVSGVNCIHAIFFLFQLCLVFRSSILIKLGNQITIIIWLKVGFKMFIQGFERFHGYLKHT